MGAQRLPNYGEPLRNSASPTTDQNGCQWGLRARRRRDARERVGDASMSDGLPCGPESECRCARRPGLGTGRSSARGSRVTKARRAHAISPSNLLAARRHRRRNNGCGKVDGIAELMDIANRGRRKNRARRSRCGGSSFGSVSSTQSSRANATIAGVLEPGATGRSWSPPTSRGATRKPRRTTRRRCGRAAHLVRLIYSSRAGSRTLSARARGLAASHGRNSALAAIADD